MAGVVNESEVYPIIDLIQREIRKWLKKQGKDDDPFDDIPSVRIYRESPLSSAIITRVELRYSGPYKIKLYLYYGGMGNPYMLDNLLAVGYHDVNDWTTEEVVKYQIFLNRNEKGVLTGVDVIPSTGHEENP